MTVLLTTVFLWTMVQSTFANNEPKVKTAVVSADQPFNETLMFPFDDKGLNIDVTMSFDEDNNILTLVLKGNRQMMVFYNDTYYKEVFKRSFLGFMGARNMKPAKLSYPVLVRPNVKIVLANKTWKSFNKKRSKHLFNEWLTDVSSDLKPFQPTNGYGLMIDSVVQSFHVDPKATRGAFHIRNVLVADQAGDSKLSAIGLKRDPTAKMKYEIVYDNDLNLTYYVNIQRNPCFGTEDFQDSIRTKISQVTRAYKNLRKACPEGKAASKKEVGIFNQHRHYLLSRFPAIADSSKCTEIQKLYNQFNAYVDSIKNAPCLYVKTADEEGGAGGGGGVSKIGIQPNTLLDAARRLDNIVAQLMISRDVAQIHDLTQTGRGIITTITKGISERGLVNEDQQRAYREFRKAQNYFNNIILRQ